MKPLSALDIPGASPADLRNLSDYAGQIIRHALAKRLRVSKCGHVWRFEGHGVCIQATREGLRAITPAELKPFYWRPVASI